MYNKFRYRFLFTIVFEKTNRNIDFPIEGYTYIMEIRVGGWIVAEQYYVFPDMTAIT